MTPDIAHALLHGFLLAHRAPDQVIAAHQILRPVPATNFNVSDLLKRRPHAAPDHIPDATKMVTSQADDESPADHSGDTTKMVDSPTVRRRWTIEEKQEIKSLLNAGVKPPQVAEIMHEKLACKKEQIIAQCHSILYGKGTKGLDAAAPPPPIATPNPLKNQTAKSKHGNPSWRERAQAAFHTPLPAKQITTTVDENGQTITKLPTGYARGITPQKSVCETI